MGGRSLSMRLPWAGWCSWDSSTSPGPCYMPSGSQRGSSREKWTYWYWFFTYIDTFFHAISLVPQPSDFPLFCDSRCFCPLPWHIQHGAIQVWHNLSLYISASLFYLQRNPKASTTSTYLNKSWHKNDFAQHHHPTRNTTLPNPTSKSMGFNTIEINLVSD